LRIISKFFEDRFCSGNVSVSLCQKPLPEQLGLHCYVVTTHPDELVLEAPLKKILDPPMVLWIYSRSHGTYKSKVLHCSSNSFWFFCHKTKFWTWGHLDYQTCNSSFSATINYVERKDKLIKANTQLIFTDDCRPVIMMRYLISQVW